MKIKYLAHSSFLITSNSGLRIITDPYTSGGMIKYAPVNEPADVVTVSHGHDDHNAVFTVKGSPIVVSKPGTTDCKGIAVKGIFTHHDESKGKQRGDNIIFCFTVDGIVICHLGDLGHTLNNEQKKEIGNVDVLLIPVGGFFTIDAKTATQICDDLEPAIAIPMHYKTPKVGLPITGVDNFLAGKKNVKKPRVNEIELERRTLPGSTEIYVLTPALL